LRLVGDGNELTWADIGHGTINRLSLGGGPVTTLASGVNPAATREEPAMWEQATRGSPAPIVIRDGTVFFVGADEPVHEGTISGETCQSSGDGGTICTPGAPEPSLVGGAGTTVRSVRAGEPPTTLLSADLAPGPSPVSSSTGIQSPDRKPFIEALALSPDGKVLYFGAGTRIYAIPSTGAASGADVTQVGFTFGPEKDVVTTLVADDHRLFYPTQLDGWVEQYDLAKPCDAAAATAGTCPERMYGSHARPLLDTLIIRGTDLFWAEFAAVHRADLTVADPARGQNDAIARFGEVLGFAVGQDHVYASDRDGYVWRGPRALVDGGVAASRALVRGQKNPRFVALDGANVYWTTDDCDIRVLPDSPQ
jgi:hypothetical protein